MQARLENVSILVCQEIVYGLTRAVCGAEGDDLLGVLLGWAGLVGAVANAIAKIRISAVAGDVACRASQLRAGDRDHVTDTRLL